jgi:hypothetical protein
MTALIAATLWIGTIDVIEDEIAMVQATASDGKERYFEMSTLMFPCEIREGDMFYFTYMDGVTEIRCGEPPE